MAAMNEITVFTAQRIITMDESLPEATALAVRDGRIVEVGTLDSLRPWLRHHEHTIDERFADRVMIAGLIDPHIHPSLMAILLNCEWIPPEPWDLARGRAEAAESKEEFLDRVAALHAERPEGEPLVIFGYHAQFHGWIVRDDLDAISADRPIALWQRSFHEIRANTAGLAWLDAEEGAAWDPHIELDSGRMYESGMVWGLRTLSPHLLGGEKYVSAMADVRTLVHRGGLTAVCDAGFGIGGGYDADYDTYDAVLGGPDTPFRTFIMPQIAAARSEWKTDTIAQLEAWVAERGTPRIRFIEAAKAFADGAFIAQLMVLGEPGYIDGHEGAWLTEPDRIVGMIRPYWEAGYDVHIHCNGDVGVGASLDAIETLLHEQPRFDHRTTLHHFGISTQAQMRRIQALGVQISANGYYLYQLGDKYVDEWLGTERTHQMTRLGSAERAGVSVSLHSDLPMGPAAPLLAAQACATRRTRGGVVMGEHERLSLEAALRSITIDAAYQLRLDHEIGSLAAGKLADVTVLGADPYEVGADGLADIPVVATIVGGEVFPVA